MNLVIQEEFVNKSIREYLEFYKVSKSTIYIIERDKLAFVNGEVKLLDYKFKSNDLISLETSNLEVNNTPISKVDIDIVYEDQDLLIVNKPPFLLVHSDGVDNDTLNNRVSFYYTKMGLNIEVRHTHRIDYETSGMVIYAKNLLTHSYLSYLFSEHKIEKKYICIALNKFDKKEGIINSNISKDRHSNKQIVCKNGKSAYTEYSVLSSKGSESRVLVKIAGGRKHQIRVHMASINHPIKGDKLYSKSSYPRMLLHFREVEFIHPRTLKTFKCVCKENF